MPTLYVETSIISYMRQRPSANVIAAARQVLTRRWWKEERHKYELVTSQYVVDEAAEGESALARARLALLEGIPLLPLAPQTLAISGEIVRRAILPEKASVDALHIAIVAFHRINYLLTWNCSHIANARLLPRIHEVLHELGYPLPLVCTPEEMVNDDSQGN